MANKKMRFCPRRFEALVLHVLSVKEMNYRTLMRVLWGIDMAAFAKQGKPITGATWTKGLDFPVPFRSAKEAKDFQKRLKRSGVC